MGKIVRKADNYFSVSFSKERKLNIWLVINWNKHSENFSVDDVWTRDFISHLTEIYEI